MIPALGLVACERTAGSIQGAIVGVDGAPVAGAATPPVATLSVKMESLIVATTRTPHRLPRQRRIRTAAADRLVTRERAVGHVECGVVCLAWREPVTFDGSADAAIEVARAAAARGLVAGEGAVRQWWRCQGSAGPPPKESFPGLAAATLLVSRLWVRVRLAPASLAIPPPLAASGVVLSPLPPKAVLSVSVHWLTVKVPKLSIPAPWTAKPLAIFSCSIATVLPLATAKTPLALSPLMVSSSRPRPSMSMLLVTASWPEVSVIVWPLSEEAKVIMSPLTAAANVPSWAPA